jgi:hypothetical protein
MLSNSMEVYSLTIYCSATLSKSEQLPEDGPVWPKHVAIEVILMSF